MYIYCGLLELIEKHTAMLREDVRLFAVLHRDTAPTIEVERDKAKKEQMKGGSEARDGGCIKGKG